MSIPSASTSLNQLSAVQTTGCSLLRRRYHGAKNNKLPRRVTVATMSRGSFCRSVNAGFGKVSRLASEDVVLHLVDSKYINLYSPKKTAAHKNTAAKA